MSQPAAASFASIGFTIAMWASAFPCIRVALAVFGPAELASLRFAVASLGLGLYLAAARPTLPRRADLPRVIAAGGLGIAAYNLLLNTGERTVDAGTASFVVNTAPIFTALLGTLLLQERLRPADWFGIALSCAGVALIATGRGDLVFGRGALLILLAAACQAAQFVLQKPLLAQCGALPVTACLLWTGGAMLLPFLPGAMSAAATADTGPLGAVLFLGLGPGALAYVAWSFALARMPASRAASFLYLVPPVATLIAWALLGEAPGRGTLLGGAVALAGVVLVNTYGRVARGTAAAPPRPR